MYFQGIHDRFIRDPEFRNRMIENHRDEDLCRRWDALADEDHTHHLTTQEFSLYKSNWWLHSNKQGSNIVPVTHRPDFKQALSTLQQLKQEAEGASQAPTYSHRNQQWHRVRLLGGIGNVHGGLLIPMKVTMEMNQALTECGDLLNSIWNNFSGQDFLELNYSVTDGSFTADSGLL